mgnify:CR=1 FL=1
MARVGLSPMTLAAKEGLALINRTLRSAAQVHGAARDAFGYAAHVFQIEANAATDSRMVFADAREIVSGGTFHGAPVAIAADLICVGLAHLATISVSAGLKAAPALERDRPPSPDFEVIAELIAAGEVERACAREVN